MKYILLQPGALTMLLSSSTVSVIVYVYRFYAAHVNSIEGNLTKIYITNILPSKYYNSNFLSQAQWYYSQIKRCTWSIIQCRLWKTNFIVLSYINSPSLNHMMKINPDSRANARVHARPWYRYTPAVYAVIFFLFFQPAMEKDISMQHLLTKLYSNNKP